MRPAWARAARESAKPEDMCLLCLGMCWSPEPVCSGPHWQHNEAGSAEEKEDGRTVTECCGPEGRQSRSNTSCATAGVVTVGIICD